MMMNCPYCGNPVEENQQVCSVCGMEFLDPEQPEQEVPAEQPAEKKAPGGKFRMILGGCVFAAALALAVTVAVLTVKLLNARSGVSVSGSEQDDLPVVPTEQTMYVTGVGEDGLPMRSELGENGGEVLTQLPLAAEVVVVDDDESAFCYVYYKAEDIYGYTKEHHLTPDPAAVCSLEQYHVNAEGVALYETALKEETVTELGTGSTVSVLAKVSDAAWYVLADGEYGYLSPDVLSQQEPVKETIIGEGAAPTEPYETYYVVNVTYYLALRNERAHSADNEIGALYNGEGVQVLEAEGDYWYVYSPKLGMYGFANSAYLKK